MTETSQTPETAELQFTDKVAIVTGAASGIGKGIARRLAAEGAKVVIADLNEQAAQDTAEELGNDAMGGVVDVADRSTVDAMARPSSTVTGSSTSSSTTPAGTKSAPSWIRTRQSGTASSTLTWSGSSTAPKRWPVV